ncbi:MAG TPA: hypothetical protein VLL54_12615 [Pyrinomonadaceae bacterium]|nr:hypothetical protein [Pyrinomonadaceae bacterium]
MRRAKSLADNHKKLQLDRLTSRPFVRELLILLAFVAITILMTWPWVLHLRDGVSDPGDPYLNAWIMWWDYFQTFHDPLHLFQAPIFYPYQYTLAYSENNYGIALLFFPLYALGLRPLTAAGLATLLGFAFSGYGAFRLARTLTGCTGAAWVAGIIFGFALYRFATISHLNYLFSGWIPLTLEALILFIRRSSWQRAAWLGVAFTMNALTCIHWFVLTLIPLALSGAFLLTHYQQWRRKELWTRLVVALAISALVLLPFLLPYQRAAKLQGTVRNSAEAATYSAVVSDWLAASPINKLWFGFGPTPDTGERHLFPGLMPIALALATIFLYRKNKKEEQKTFAPSDPAHPESFTNAASNTPKLLLLLDSLAMASLLVAVIAYGYQGIQPFGLRQFHVPDATRPLVVLVVLVVVRLCLSYPPVLRFGSDRNLLQTMRRSEIGGLGLIWIVLGFFGSLGMNFFFHRALFEYVFIFRSIRVPARWAMIAMLGLSLIAAVGARRVAQVLSTKQPRLSQAIVFGLICCLLLFEARSAPMTVYHGEVDPDPVTVFLAKTPMRGGLVHLPSGLDANNHRYVLRQADHGKPLITAFSGFGTPTLTKIETLSSRRPIPDEFLDLLEGIPTSYLVVHEWALPPPAVAATQSMLFRGVLSGRLRYVGKFAGSGINGNDGAELYALTRIEPNAQASSDLPPHLVPHELGKEVQDDPTFLVSEFDRWSFPLYLIYKVSFNRTPRHAEFVTAAQSIGTGVVVFGPEWETQLQNNLQTFAEGWVNRPEFKQKYSGKTATQVVDQMYANIGIAPETSKRNALVNDLQAGNETSASVLLKVISDEAVIQHERDPAFVLLHYFGFLRRDPDDPPDNSWNGFNFWRDELEKSGEPARVTRGFMSSGEYEAIKKRGSR